MNERTLYIGAAFVALAVLTIVELSERVQDAEKRLCSLGAELFSIRRELAVARHEDNTSQLRSTGHKVQRRPAQRLTRAPKGA